MVSQSPPPRLSRHAQTLIQLAEALSRSGSALEDRYWQQQLAQAFEKALAVRNSRHVELALETMLEARSAAYEVLVEQAETHSESMTLGPAGARTDVQLICAPMLAWTRYQLPSGHLNRHARQALLEALRDHVVAPDALVAVLPELIRFDRLPQHFYDARQWTLKLGQCALDEAQKTPALGERQALEGMLADVYFLIAAVAVPEGAPLFRWQSATASSRTPTRESVTPQWVQACSRILEPVFTGCVVDYLCPEAYYANTREADLGIRPVALKAAITWLSTAAQVAPADLRAAIIGCGESAIEEYRIGFSLRDQNDVIYGCIWPALSREESSPELGPDDQPDAWESIAALLREQGLKEIRRLPGVAPLDFCEDCGTPFFPNMHGDMQHPELPDEIDPEPVQLH